MSATTTPVPSAPTDPNVRYGCRFNVSSQPAPAVTAASPPVNTIENLDVLKDDAPPKNKVSHRPAYLDYDEEVFKQKLQLLVDPSRWAEGSGDMNRVMVKWYKSFTRRQKPLPALLQAVIPFFVYLKDNPAECHKRLVQFLNGQNHQSRGTPTTTNPIPVSSPAVLHVAINPSPTTILPISPVVEPPSTALKVVPVPPATRPSSAAPPLPPAPHRAPSPPCLLRPFLLRPADFSTLRPSHLPPNTMPMNSYATTRHQYPSNSTRDKGKGRHREVSSADEENEDDVELKEEIVIKKEPITVKLEPDDEEYVPHKEDTELDDSDYQEPRTLSTATNARRRKPNAVPKTLALAQDAKDEDGPVVIDRFAVAGVNDPPCNNCASRHIPCEFFVDEWVTRCKLCHWKKVGCTVSAPKRFALKNSGRKRVRPLKANNITRSTVKKEPTMTKVPRSTPATRNSHRKNLEAVVGVSSHRRDISAGVTELRDELAELRKLPETFDQLRTEIRHLRQEVLEIRSAQDNLIASTNQQSVRLVENQALFLGEISALLRQARLSVERSMAPPPAPPTTSVTLSVPLPPSPPSTGLASPSPANAISMVHPTAAPQPALTEGPKDETRTTKRARSSSVVSTRSSKRRRGEIPA